MRLFLYSMIFLGFLSPASAAPVTPAIHQEREAFSHDFADKVLAILQDQKKTMGDRKDVLRQAFSASVDIDWIARFVLGRSWSNASPAQQAQYSKLYRTYLTESYVANFGENPDKRIRDIKIFGVNDEEGDDFSVRTQMMLADGENLNVMYRVRETDRHYRVVDIAIENVSLITTHRAEFGQLASTRGVDGVIARLEQLVHGEKQLAMR